MKVCIKCKITKNKSEFYGVQGDCKECTKKRVRKREDELLKDPQYHEKEKARHRAKYHRLEYKEKHKPTTEQKKKIMDRYKEKYPEKIAAKNKCSSLKPKIKGNHLHHWSYRPEHAKDVIEIAPNKHATIHRYMIYDQERMQYRTKEGVLLDTINAHETYIINVLAKYK